jgi:glycosyltransferase involved in cell wall biosynthesis
MQNSDLKLVQPDPLITRLNTIPRNIYFYAKESFEKWDYTNPMLIGIGGSEVSQIEMASRLAHRGHNVTSYAPVPWDGTRINRDASWTNFKNATFTEPGLWIIYRVPEVLDNFILEHLKEKGQEIWLVAQDVFYTEMTEERAAKIDKYICLCPDHEAYIQIKYPYLKDKTIVSSNGINVDLINALKDNNVIPRNPHRLIYSSSPDRGLEQLIPIFKKAREFVPDLELHVFYGFDNIDKIIKDMPWVAAMKDSIMGQIDSTDGIHWHGRIGQIELLIEWMKSGIWCYPVNFTETSCISCMEAQACGVIPIASAVWALRTNVQHGILIEGEVKDDKLTIVKFAADIVRVCRSQELRDRLTKDMEIDAKVRFNWERYVDQWESWMYQPKCNYFFDQYAFQQKFAFGRILNVGCDTDASEFHNLRGAVNLDVQRHGNAPVDIYANILEPTVRDIIEKAFDTVIVGDLLEHMTFEQGTIALTNASYGLKDSNSLLIVTCPEDKRSTEEQNPTLDPKSAYIGGVSLFHRLVNLDELIEMIAKAGLRFVYAEQYDATHYKGWGVLCRIP